MGLSLAERKKKLMEECAACAAGGGATVGNDGFEGSADSSGPNAGFDPLLRTLKKLKKKDKPIK